MNIQNLVKMANQIGIFFEDEPDSAQATRDVASHLKRFWEPRMRKTLLHYVENGGEGLLPIVTRAVRENQQLLG